MISHLVCYDSITAVFTLGLTVFNSKYHSFKKKKKKKKKMRNNK